MVLDEVRATYLRRQYRQCSIRCMQLLEAAPNMVRQHPVNFPFKDERLAVVGEQYFHDFDSESVL